LQRSQIVQFVFNLRVAIRAQKIAFCGFFGQNLKRTVGAIADIEGKRFGVRVAVMEREGT
jgi:hypothetical protein